MAVLRGEGVDALLNRDNQLGPGRDAGGNQVAGIEDRPAGVTQLALRLGAHLGQQVVRHPPPLLSELGCPAM